MKLRADLFEYNHQDTKKNNFKFFLGAFVPWWWKNKSYDVDE